MEQVKTDKKDFLNGKILKKLIFLAIPMAIATFLQMLFNAADVAVVGQFAGSHYQAAVGATTSTVHLIVNLFVGIAVGANVTMANAFGAKDEKRQHRVTHTAMATSLVTGIIVLLVGLIFAERVLRAVDTPEVILQYSSLYLQVYFLGAPAMMVYNFGAALMRGVGETKKPLYYLFVSGILNVIINVITVVFFKWHVVGVALGTTVSQYFSAVWIVIDLKRGKYGVTYQIRKTRFHKKEFKKMLFVGVPMGISSCMFSFSNLFVQSAMNAYGEVAIAGNTVAATIESMQDAFSSSVEKSVVTIVGQNIGANKPRRVHRIIGAGLFANLCAMATTGCILGFFGRYVCMLFNSDQMVLDWAMRRILVVSVTYGLVSFMNSYGGALRGMGYSVLPMLVNLFFICLVRIAYLSFIYPTFAVHYIEQVYILYPITWILAGFMQMIVYYVVGYKQGHFKKGNSV